MSGLSALAGNASDLSDLATYIAQYVTNTAGAAPSGTVGTPYAGYTAVATNSYATYSSPSSLPASYSVTGGSLPTNLSMSSGGVVSGTPSTAGTFNATVQASNATGSNGTFNLSITIAARNTTTSLGSSSITSNFGSSITLTATVTGTNPTGTVTFLDNGSSIGTGSVSGGTATLNTSALSVGSHNLTASYGGNASNNGSTSSPALVQTVKAVSSTTLGSSVNPSNFGSSTTLTATVTGSSPTGTVTFFDVGVSIGTGSVSGGVATLATSALAAGSHNLTATYGGDGSNTSSTTSAATVQLVKALSTTSLNSSSNPSTLGGSITLTATVSGSTPSGTVTFYDGGSSIGSGTVAAGTATLSISNLPVGSHSLTAQYAGDTNNVGSTSSVTTQVVNVVPTSTALSTLTTPTAFNSAATFNATVTGTSPTGTVTFYDGINSIGTGTLNGSFVASLAVSNLSVAAHNITAVYGGDGNNGGSTSAIVVHTVNSAASATSLASNANPSTFGGSVTWTATITGPTPTGTVTFKDGSTTIGSATVSGGSASLTLSSLSVGPHSLTAVYGGDVNNAASTSATLTQTVNAVVSGTVLASSVNPSAFGSPTTLTATVSGSTPTGVVTFKDGGTTIGSVPVITGVVTLTVPNFTVGTHNLTAVYGGDTNNTASTSAVLVQAVINAASSTLLNSSVNPTVFGGATLLTAAVGGVNPSGTVTFKDGATVLGTATLVSPGLATLSVSSLSVGAHSLTAVYSGDGNNAASTSAVTTQNVSTVTSAVVLSSGTNPSAFSSSVNLTAAVTGAAPTGSVTFKDGASTVGTATVANGVATLAITSLSVGSHSLSAVYGGDTNNAASTSATITQVVNVASASITLASSANPSVVGIATVLRATISGVSPTGSVTFKDGTAVLGSSAVSAGAATLSVSSLGVGAHSLTAAYGGDTNNGAITSAALTQTVNPAGLPTITGPANGTALSFALNVATNVQLVATNFATSYAVTPALPTGFSLNTATGLVSVTAVAPMASTAYTFTASNVLGAGAATVINFAVGAPAPGACAVSTPLNTAQTVDLAPCAYPGLAPSGFVVTAAPAHGTAVITGTRLTYTPANNFFGSDSLAVAATFGSLRAAAGNVPITVTGRPDPTQNAAVTGLTANQTQTAIRFTQAQASNFGRHMESLRSPGGGLGFRRGLSGLTPAGAQLLQAPATADAWTPQPGAGSAFGTAALTAAPQATLSANPGWAGASAGNLYSTANNATQLPTGTSPTVSLPVESGVMMAMNQLQVPQAPLIGLLYNFDQNRKLDLGMLKRAFGNGAQTGDNLPGTSVWVEGVVSFGTRDANGSVKAAEFSSNGISVGMDMPVNDAFTWGMGVGLARDVAYVGTDGSRNQSQGYSLAAYGSYLLGDNAFVEGMLGVGTIDYDMRRWVDPAADFAVSNRKGLQYFGSMGTGLEFRKGGQMISPYMRLDFSQDQLQEVSETGAGSYALHFFEQTNNSSQAVLGLRGEAVHSTSFGWAVPRARVEWRQDLQSGSDAVISYADQIGGTRYSIAPTDSMRSAFVFGLGSEFLFRDGWALGVDYQLSRASSTESSYALRLRLSKEFGAKGLRKLLKEDEENTDDESEIMVESSATWDDNVTRAKLGSDIRSDTIYSVNISRTLENQLSDNTRYLLTGVATGERFQNFNGLSRFALSGEATLQYRASAEFSAPTWSLVAKYTGEDFQSAARDGNRYAAGGTVLAPMTDRINLFAALTYNKRDANSLVFTTEDTSLRMNVDYALRSGATLYMGAEFRDGDIVSSGRSSLENITTANALMLDDAFPGGTVFAYRLKGATLIGTFGYNIGLGARDSLDFSWRYVQSTPYSRPAWATSPASYITNQISASYLMRF